jgi:predicted nucleic acid-binding protein
MPTTVNEFTVVLDACVLAPMPVCDTLLRLAEDPSFYIPKWSGHIMAEVRSTLSKFGYPKEKTDRRISAMSLAFEDALVTGYEGLIPSMTNNEKDRHVLAAAVRCKADAIVTENWKHFPPASVDCYGILVLKPDDFFVHQLELNADAVCDKIESQALAKRETPDILISRLAKHTPEFSKRLAAIFN